MMESDGDLLARLGMDGAKWAAEFSKRYPSVPEDEAIGWFCNAIMAGYDRGRGCGPVVLPDGSAVWVG